MKHVAVSRLPFVVLTAAMLLATHPAAAATAPSWLDAAVPSPWNAPGAAVPIVARDIDLQLDARCAAQQRPPSPSPADSAVAAAGWTLIGPLQVYGGTELVTAASAADGMCRPLGYQAFVFVDGVFAGTLSPGPMDARTDGIVNSVRLFAADHLTGEFTRYAERDPLCCPSAVTYVTFAIRRSNGLAVVVPTQLYTRPDQPAATSAHRPDRQLANTYWKFVRLADREVTIATDQREPHLILRIDGRTVSGSTGCNGLSGGYTLEGEALSFGGLATTRMMCPETMDQERLLLDTLGLVRGWRIEGDRLELLEKDGGTLARLQAVDLK